MKYKTKIWESDFELLIDILKNIVFAGFVAMLIDFEISPLKLIITVSAALLTFPLRRRIIKKKEEVNND